jgi:hypothetical protein
MPEDIEFYTGVNAFSDLGTVLGYKKEPTPFEGMTDLFGL